jgi:pyrimidine operon attenuation protein/uracil phosphoribosyltransferase
MDAELLYKKLLAHLQARTSKANPPFLLAGLAIGGAWIAERLACDLGLPNYGVINVAFHRDDYAEKAWLQYDRQIVWRPISRLKWRAHTSY